MRSPVGRKQAIERHAGEIQPGQQDRSGEGGKGRSSRALLSAVLLGGSACLLQALWRLPLLKEDVDMADIKDAIEEVVEKRQRPSDRLNSVIVVLVAVLATVMALLDGGRTGTSCRGWRRRRRGR